MLGKRLLVRALAFLRTRLLGAVVLPALVGAAWVARSGRFPMVRFAIALAGLAAAELVNLLGADYAAYRAAPGRRLQPPLPGNPVISPLRLPPQRIPLVASPLALVAAAVALYFVRASGSAVLLLLLAGGAVGALYVLEPLPFSFLATALVPPLICGGVVLALTGRTQPAAFLAGLPIALVSAGVILGYRWLHPGAHRRQSRVVVVLACYSGGAASTALLVVLGVLPPAALGAALLGSALVVPVARRLRREAEDPVPATAMGVIAHSASCLALALGLLL